MMMNTMTWIAAVITEPQHLSLPLQMLIIFGAAKLAAEILERFGLPGIVGEIVAGIIIGPSVIAWIAPSEFLTALSELGVMFLLFRVGLEVKASEFVKIGIPASVIALLGVLVPFACGWFLAALWDYTRLESIFMGAGMVATSVGITAQFLATKGLLQQRASQIILAAAVIDDVLGLLILAVVSSVARGGVNVLELATTAVLAILFTVIVARWGTTAMKVVVPRVEESLKVSESQFAFAMFLLFALSAVAVYAGVAAIIGAFLAGMALADTVSKRVHDLTNGVAELLVPFFLVGIGLQFNIAVLTDPSLLFFAFIVVLAAIASKFIGCGIAGFRFGRIDAVRIGIGMIPRGEVGMVVAQLGMGLSVISEGLFAVIVFMSVLTTIAAPPLLKVAFRNPVLPQASSDVIRIG